MVCYWLHLLYKLFKLKILFVKKNNSIVTKLDLSDNWLGPQGAEYISRMLKENCFICDLVNSNLLNLFGMTFNFVCFKNLSENHLFTQGCEKLREILKLNSSLTHLTFQGNNFDDSTAPIWADIISVNSSFINFF